MNSINTVLNWLADQLLAPFVSIPLVGLLFWSAVTGVVMTYVIGKTSNQTALRRAADQVRAQLLAIRLFKDDLTVTLRCQVELMKASAVRFVHSLPPMIVMIVPFAFILSQLGLRYENRPLQPGESVVVEMRLAPEAWQQYKDVALDAPEGVLVETESLRDQSSHTLYWRLRPDTGQTASLRWQLGDETIEKRLAVADDAGRLQPVSALRPGTDLLDRLIYPGEPGFDAGSPVRGIAIHYAPRQTLLFGIDVPWWATFFIASMLVALLVRRFLGVQF